MTQTLILYSSVHGHTHKVCQRVAERLHALGELVTIAALDRAPSLSTFDKVVVGASIRHGKHNADVYAFVAQHQPVLDKKLTGFFSVSLVARKAAKNTPETNPYMQAFLAKTSWQPKVLSVFAGKLNYQGYSRMDRNIIRFIMWLTNGPTEPNTNVEYTDWKKVDEFAYSLFSLNGQASGR